MTTSKPSFILILALFLAACGESSSSAPGGTQPLAPGVPVVADRPSTEPVIISRDLLFENDERISYCEVLANDNQSYSGYRDQELYPLASLSKVITTSWALKKLGPDHRFQITWFLRPLSQTGVYDAYLKTNYDPVFNIEKILYSLSLLKAHGVVKIRNLVIDESTRVYLSVLSQPHIELEQIPVSSSESASNLELILNSKNWSTQTNAAKQRLTQWAQENGKALQIPNSFSVENVDYKKANAIETDYYTQKVTFKSALLIKYLKNLNIYSNNYLSDALFQLLGGVTAFEKFQLADLKLGYDQLQLYTGSGLADETSGVRKDNLGSCFAMIKVLNYIDQQAAGQGLNLGHVLYNPAQEKDGTFESALTLSNQVVFKTGRLFENPAFNLAGIISTTKGHLYFTFLGHNFTADEANEIEKARNKMLINTLNHFDTKATFQTLQDPNILL